MSKVTLEQLNEWALKQTKGFIPSPAEIKNRFYISAARVAFQHTQTDTAKNSLKWCECSNKAIIYFAIREFVGFENEQSWLAFIKVFVESNSENN